MPDAIHILPPVFDAVTAYGIGGLPVVLVTVAIAGHVMVTRALRARASAGVGRRLGPSHGTPPAHGAR